MAEELAQFEPEYPQPPETLAGPSSASAELAPLYPGASASTDIPGESPASVDKRVVRRRSGPFKRSRTGCGTCKKRGKKCDEEWSEEGFCQRCLAGSWDCTGRSDPPIKRARTSMDPSEPPQATANPTSPSPHQRPTKGLPRSHARPSEPVRHSLAPEGVDYMDLFGLASRSQATSSTATSQSQKQAQPATLATVSAAAAKRAGQSKSTASDPTPLTLNHIRSAPPSRAESLLEGLAPEKSPFAVPFASFEDVHAHESDKTIQPSVVRVDEAGGKTISIAATYAHILESFCITPSSGTPAHVVQITRRQDEPTARALQRYIATSYLDFLVPSDPHANAHEISQRRQILEADARNAKKEVDKLVGQVVGIIDGVLPDKSRYDALWTVFNLHLLDLIGARPIHDPSESWNMAVQLIDISSPRVNLATTQRSGHSDTLHRGGYIERLMVMTDLNHAMLKGTECSFEVYTEMPDQVDPATRTDVTNSYLGLDDSMIMLLHRIVNMAGKARRKIAEGQAGDVNGLSDAGVKEQTLRGDIDSWERKPIYRDMGSVDLVKHTTISQLWKLTAQVLFLQLVKGSGILHLKLRAALVELFTLLDSFAQFPNQGRMITLLPAFLAATLSISETDRARATRHLVIAAGVEENQWVKCAKIIWGEVDEGVTLGWQEILEKKEAVINFF